MLYIAPVFLPLIGAAIVGLFGRVLGDRPAQIVSCVAMGAAAITAIIVFNNVVMQGEVQQIYLFNWISSGDFQVDWALRIDELSAMMMFTVTIVSFLIHVYSIGYMAHDPNVPRFFSYLSLFTFFMLALVTADNFLQLYFGWEGVGLVSYLLIGFWYKRPAANAAAIKAFVVNRVGDFGFALGILAIYLTFGSISFDTVFAAAPNMVDVDLEFLGGSFDALTVICILLFVGAMGKSAQFLLHTWLPDAMEGPTPVSALIHAATMVTAGVFLVARCSPLFEYAPIALAVVTFVGATTAIFAATIAITQNDIKRVIAYSTCSQLGYMFFACGVSAYSAGMFHLTTHAFFKALLFLGAGSVIHAMSDEQDMRKMGGIWKAIPLTYTLMWIGSLALAGVPFFSGFFSKDIILESAFAAETGLGYYAYAAGIAAAILTALYSWRLIILTFHGKPRADEKVMAHVHESPAIMTVPLILLAVGAIVAGYLLLPMVGSHSDFWGTSILVLPHNNALEGAHHVAFWVKALPTIVAVIGILAAYYLYMTKPQLPAMLAERLRPLYLFSLNKWYFDELYDWMFVRPAKYLGHGLWKQGDGGVIDGIGPDGIAAAATAIARRVVKLQSGYLYHYAFLMLAGVAVIITWYLILG
ncbi:MAG: NADH-quinone oxidoreductase subunit L [Rhodospirillaceae bacterium]|nr:NADH-quinone oxidoreductase subunit L [Rhodospirillaceae bacterium]MBT4427371.1 NADH-quinone oxidoreductase subunit L [Rhodospirillaceae bacterium]MBT5037038.1 NADH-quinone oxidoreductase subunit L [Rhodospirillaceae bacterium]MBT5674528.1 NADH-quinone oxidoreductase subunit L [Rhodospirillaceae bacterium]MBT7292291.1 NADH-quinone oxidoreductase subunit L [Rhodospirillaceae bacterium]